MKTIIELPSYNIKITLGYSPAGECSGTITSDLSDDYDAITSFILAMACEGIDVTTPAMLCAIETTIDGIANAE